jgi:cysteinyl-tRNA synthetase
MVRIRDSLLRDTVELVPREPGAVSMYVCGPTVYDVPHVGHGRTALVFDVIRRYLAWRGYAVTFVSNVTDVEDKIIARAADRGTTEAELAAEFEAVYFEQLARLGVDRADHTPHATEYIAEMLALVGELVGDGHAYLVEGQGVYFDVRSFAGYGALPHRSLAELLDSAGARVEVDEAKHSPIDFALWKAAKPGEPTWDSPWGPGRPGWHIECSAMSLDLLGEGFDIHGGGDDLAFPHHENERAQAEAAGHPFARHWIHSGMVLVGGEKMSKSLGNFTTLADALDAHGPRAFRLAVLQSHYRKPMDLGPTELEAAKKGVERFEAMLRAAAAAGIVVDDTPTDAAAFDDPSVGDFRSRFVAAMDDDFNTPLAMGVVFEAVREANRAITAGERDRAAALVATVRELTGALGLELGGDAPDDGADAGTTDDAEIDTLVRARDEARAARDFARADLLRDDLTARGITLEDTPAGTVWRR